MLVSKVWTLPKVYFCLAKNISMLSMALPCFQPRRSKTSTLYLRGQFAGIDFVLGPVVCILLICSVEALLNPLSFSRLPNFKYTPPPPPPVIKRGKEGGGKGGRPYDEDEERMRMRSGCSVERMKRGEEEDVDEEGRGGEGRRIRMRTRMRLRRVWKEGKMKGE